ncbi:Uncharacterised protein [Listeria grayi]|uniref:plantaricin C family lantibiotic n=1 Tax=Listeria grayi TaxID=1641 RepID=UPI0004B6FA81|nr:plantaricin C family lantibiotic [Listeria grayi]VEI31233.1 Uncharacterised protein [Listeria grayi]
MEKKEWEKTAQIVQEGFLQEVEEQEIGEESGGAWWNVSKNLGNKGRICTLTKECQSMCN